ncbi:MAG: hypothetical protein U1F68_08470 [Gammaproteobacteria bacterium]
MAKWLDQVADVCLLRSGPQDLPYSYALLEICVLAYGLSGLGALLLGFGAQRWFGALILTLIDMGLIAGFSYAMLSHLGQINRWVQTLTALFGVGALLQVASLPLTAWQAQALDEKGDPSLPWLLSQGLAVWSIMVNGHILQQAFSTSRGIGVAYALGYFFLLLVIGELILPPLSP